MDKNQQKLASKTAQLNNVAKPQQRAKWSSSSKFNKILNNLERSILNQFNGGHNSNDSNTTTSTSTSKQNNALRKKFNPSSTTIHQQASTSRQQNKRCNEQQVQKQKDSHQVSSSVSKQPDSVALQTTAIKSDASNRCKTTLNKYQQQLVSTMRSNQLIVNNKLSIPPPHANDEARNQNHRLLFGDTADAQQSLDTSLNSPSNIRQTIAKSGIIIGKQDDVSQRIDTLRLNSSPAISAKSLPTLATKPGSQGRSRTHINEDEESGFSTYQSRRSLITTSANEPHQQISSTSSTKAPPPPPPPPPVTSSSSSLSSELKKANNMISMQTNQMPMSARSFTHHQMNTSPHFLLSYQHPNQMKFNNTQQFVAINQVPIISSTDSINNCYTTSNSNQIHQMTSNLQRPINQNQFSDQQQQLYGLYGQNVAILPFASIDNSQQIYANAPPKPRRYQYYDSNQTIIPQMITPMTMSQTTVSNSNGAFNNQAAFLNSQQCYPQQQQQQMNLRQSQLSNQPIYNISYLQLPTIHQQSSQANSERANPAFNGSYIQSRQQMNLPPPPPMTKSKSSLDACDLVRFRLDKSLDSNHAHNSNTLRVHPQQQQKFILCPRFDNRNRYSTSIQQQPLDRHMQFVSSNLQRSKSVSHLLQEHERNQLNLQTRDMFNNRQATIGPKFLSVSSASTTNLNYTGLANNQQLLLSNNQQSQQFNKISSQLNISQQQAQQYHDSIQHQSNQLFSIAAPPRQQHHHQQQQKINNWQNHQTLPSCHDFNNQSGSNRINLKETNSILSNNRGKFIRQQSQSDCVASSVLEDGFNKPSLDDKIRYLMIGQDDSEAANILRGGGGNSKPTVDDNVIYDNNNSNANNTNVTQTWRSKNALDQSIQGSNSISKNNDNSSTELFTGSSRATNYNQQQYFVAPSSELTNRIYIDDSSYKMGNRQQGQYQINNSGKQNAESAPLRIQVGHKDQGLRKNDANNSHLIVDLTTPRVLAKTQTNLSQANNSSTTTDLQHNRDSWSLNQVGLPQPITSSSSSNQQASSETSKKQTAFLDSSTNNQAINLNYSDQDVLSTLSQLKEQKPICTAPYYYSDLKSEEQRNALLNIVQQKSLSPPPQLLSRSTDQSSTRLGPKSATLHSSRARLLSDTLAQRNNNNNNIINVNGNNLLDKSSTKHSQLNDLSATLNIAENIDKLFESPIQGTDKRLNAVQSMLALNDSIDSSHLSSFQTNLESISSGYNSADLRSKNFSKSKSLENICGDSRWSSIASKKADNEANNNNKLIGSSNPVYENINRSDKLLSAINNSTTCLSSSSSSTRSCSHRRTRATDSNLVNEKDLDDSMDSILGSSLESDSSLDFIDEIKLSPSDNNLNDISQLIEQLKSNHSKLSEEYKSTLIRISKTIDNKSKQVNGDQSKSDKLMRKIELLELKSKKCESRSRNQLALIQMMEKVLKQSKIRANLSSSSLAPQKHHQLEDRLSPENLVSSSNESEHQQQQQQHQNKSSIKSNRVEQLCPSPCLSFDYKSVKQSNGLVGKSKQGQGSKWSVSNHSSSNGTSRLNEHQQQSKIAGSQQSKWQHCGLSGAKLDQQQSQNFVPSRRKQSVMRAEQQQHSVGALSKMVELSEVKRNKPDETSSSSSLVSLSTRHLQQSNAGREMRRCSQMDLAALDRDLDLDEPEEKGMNIKMSKKKNLLRDSSSSSYSHSTPMNASRASKERVKGSSSSSLESDGSGSRFDNCGGSASSNCDSPNGAKLEADGLAGRQSIEEQQGLLLSEANVDVDEEDFIEFLTNGDTKSGPHSAQFDASQFSASDFNSSSSNSESSSTQSNAPTNDSLSSPLIGSNQAKHLFTNGRGSATDKANGKTHNIGILKVQHSQANNNNGCSSSSSSSSANSKSNGNNNNLTNDIASNKSDENEKRKFNNVLGNVIDVDIYPINNSASQCSPVNNQA